MDKKEWITVGTVTKDTPREEVSKLIEKAVKEARRLGNEKNKKKKDKAKEETK